MNKKRLLENNEHPVCRLALKNGATVELTKQDIIDNNISKLENAIPDLKISNNLSDNSFLNKVLSVLETGIQCQHKYYKYLCLFILCHVWLIQIIALINEVHARYSMLLISFWMTYAILRFQFKPYFRYNILLSLVKKIDVPFFLSSITFSLIILSMAYELLTPNRQCLAFYWSDIGKLMLFYGLSTITYYKFLIICCLYIALLMSVYDIYTVFEKYRLELLFGVETIGVKIFKFVCIIGLLYFLPNILSDKLCDIKDGGFIWGIIPILLNYVFYAFFANVFVGFLFFIKNIVLRHH